MSRRDNPARPGGDCNGDGCFVPHCESCWGAEYHSWAPNQHPALGGVPYVDPTCAVCQTVPVPQPDPAPAMPHLRNVAEGYRQQGVVHSRHLVLAMEYWDWSNGSPRQRPQGRRLGGDGDGAEEPEQHDHNEYNESHARTRGRAAVERSQDAQDREDYEAQLQRHNRRLRLMETRRRQTTERRAAEARTQVLEDRTRAAAQERRRQIEVEEGILVAQIVQRGGLRQAADDDLVRMVNALDEDTVRRVLVVAAQFSPIGERLVAGFYEGSRWRSRCGS